MSVLEFLNTLRDQKIKIWAEGDNLRFRTSSGALPPNLRKEISERKNEILSFLHQTAKRTTLLSPPVPVSRKGTLPLSFAEERQWFIHQLEPDSAIYNIFQAYRLNGPLNEKSLALSVSKLINRHESLRTTFSHENGQPMRIITNTPSFKLPVIDLSELTTTDRAKEVQHHIAGEAKITFDLQSGPLFRVHLLRLTDEEHIFIINMHHIISDGWSMDTLWRELSILYDALCNDRVPQLPDLPIQYADFAHWQRTRDHSLYEQLAYWKENLRNIPPLITLPTDRARTNKQNYRGASIRASISPEVTQTLHSLGQQKNVTLFMLLLTVFKVLLFRYSAEEDVVVGTPIANRTMAHIEGVIGFFINTLVIRSNLSSNPTFTQLLAQVRNTTLNAYQHQDLPFEKLVGELSPERTLSHNPLFQVMFVLENTDEQVFSLPNVEITQIPKDQQAAKFDLMLIIKEREGCLQTHFSYRSELFDEPTIKRMTGHFQTLLEGIVINPETPISDLPLLTEAERHQLLVGWNDTAVDYPRDKCIHQLIEDQVEHTPNAIAFIFGIEQLTYRQLNARANQLAHYLQTLGVGPDVLVGICVERSIEMAVGIVAILKAGGAYVPIEPHLPQERIAYMLKDAQIKVLLTEQKWVSNLPHTQLTLVCLDIPTTAISEKSQENLINLNSSANLVYAIYTSGSTGMPKGAGISHRNLSNYFHWQITNGLVKATDRVLQSTTISFDMAVQETLAPLLTGATVIIPPPNIHQSLSAFIEQLVTHKITYLGLPPSFLRVLLEEPKFREKNYLRQVIAGGEALDVNLRDDFLKNSNSVLLNLYGPTETTITASFHQCQRTDKGKTVSIGRPIGNTQIYLLDSFQQLVPIGHIGELCIAGDCVGNGYLNKPELTAEKFVSNPFGEGTLYKTGDLARYQPDGSIEYLGRKDYQVKIRGFRIELGEVENALNSLPEVKEAVVMVRENENADKQLIAYVVGDTTQKLRADLASRLPNYMIPSFFVAVDSLPLLPNGKIDRHALPELDMSKLTNEELFIAPRSIAEKQLAGIWSELLHLERVGIHDNFFELGGHSLKATQVVSRIRDTFQIELPLRTLFERPTVSHLAQYVETLINTRDITLPISDEEMEEDTW